MKCLSLTCVSFVLFSSALFGQERVPPSPADQYWQQIRAVTEAAFSRGEDQTKNDQEAQWENGVRQARALGLEFWDRFPNDARRYEWLYSTVLMAPRYTASQIDERAAQEWHHRFETELKPAYLAYPGLSRANIAQFLLNAVRAEYVRGNAVDVRELVAATAAAAADPALESRLEYMGGLIASLPEFLPDAQRAAAQRDIWRALKESHNPALQLVGAGRQLLASFQMKPFTYRGTALDGREVDLERMRDKIVFVDMWATTCSGCIAAMPHIKEIYEKYREHGFEVVGIAFNSEEDRAEIERLMTKLSIPWPQLLAGRPYGPNKSQLWRDLGLSGVPVTLLLGHDGKVITNDLRSDNLEIEVRRALGLPPQS